MLFTKLDIILKVITFEKIASHTKYEKTNVPRNLHIHIFWLNFDNTNHSFLDSFLLLKETDFWKNVAWGIFMFLSVFHCWLHLFTSLFFHCCCCCTTSATDLRQFIHSFIHYHYFILIKKTLPGLQALKPNNNTKLIIKRNNS